MKRNRIIWVYALGLVAFYTPYAALSKAVTAGIVPGVPLGLVGLEILPASIIGTVLTVPLIITLAGWWPHARIGRIAGIPLPVTTPEIALSGVGLALIIGSTTVAYTFKGISIVLALILMRGGLLIMAPLVDSAYRRRVRWFSWAALIMSFTALGVSLGAAKDKSLPFLAFLNLSVYLTGYGLRTPLMTKLAKVEHRDVTRSYFVQEVLVTLVVLPLLPGLYAMFGHGTAAIALRRGFTTFWSVHPAAVVPVVLIGVFYACHNIFGTLIYLDGRENTFCVSLFCASSFMAGLLRGRLAGTVDRLPDAARFAIRFRRDHRAGSAAPFPRAPPRRGCVGFRHWPPACAARPCSTWPACASCSSSAAATPAVRRWPRRSPAPSWRSPQRSPESAQSAGLEPHLGSPMNEMSRAALDRLAVPHAHQARALRAEEVERAEAIYCMTASQREALLALSSSSLGEDVLSRSEGRHSRAGRQAAGVVPRAGAAPPRPRAAASERDGDRSDSVRLRFHWSMSSAGEKFRGAKARAAVGVPSLETLARFCRHAEECEIESLLTAFGFHRPDPLVLAAALGVLTSRIKFMVAVRSGVMSPTLFVQQVNSVSALTGGRICLNVVGRPYPGGARLLRRLPRARRALLAHRRVPSGLRCLLASRRRSQFRRDAVPHREGKLNIPFVAPDRGRPEIFLGGGSALAEQLAIKHADCLWRLPDTPEKLRARTAEITAHGVEVGLLVSLIVRPTHQEAVRATEAILEEVGEQPKRTHEDFAKRSDSVAFTSTYELAASKDWLTPYLWTGAVPYLGAPAMAIVGSPDEVTEALFELRAAGITQFLFMGWPDMEEMSNFHAEVLPRVRAREAAEAA